MMKRLALAVAMACWFSISARAQVPEQLSPELAPPTQLQIGGRPIDLQRSGQAAPCFADFDGDGVRDLMVGQYDEGRLRIYRNVKSNAKPRFNDVEWLLADGQPASVPVSCCIGFTPQLVDLDGDERQDVLSGSAPGEIYLFRRRAGDTFAAGEKLCTQDGKPLNIGTSTTAHAVDWNGDSRLDLLLGNAQGQISIAINGSSDSALRFEAPQPIKLNDPRNNKQESAPVAADWDGDGRFDLVMGSQEGSVYWFRNIGKKSEHQFAQGECLLPKSLDSARNDWTRNARDWGYRTKPWVADFNDDGRLDLLVGDCCGSFVGKPEQTLAEIAEEQTAMASLLKLRSRWAMVFQEYRKLLPAKSQQEIPENATVNDSRRKELLAAVKRLKTEMEQADATVAKYQPCPQSHGFVWLFLRQPTTAPTNRSISLPKRETSDEPQ